MMIRIALALALTGSSAWAQNVDVGDGGALQVEGGGEIQVDTDGIEVESGGKLSVIGTGASAHGRIEGPSGGRAPITVLSGGTVDLKFATLERLSTLFLATGTTLIRLEDTTFLEPAGLSASTVEWLDLSALLAGDDPNIPDTMTGVTFSDLKGTPSRKNVKGGGSTPDVAFVGTTAQNGNRFGAAFETDPSGHVHWDDGNPPTDAGTPVATPSPSQGTHTVSWTASTDPGGSGVEYYEVERSVNGGAFAFLVNTALTSINESGLSQATYKYRVRAKDWAGFFSQNYATSANVIVDLTDPTTPGTPVASPNPNNGSHTITWTASTDSGGSGLSHYVLEKSIGGGAFQPLATPATNSYPESGLPEGTYTYRVRAVDNAGNESANSATSAVVTVDLTPPTVPGVPIGSPNPNVGTYTVTWTASTDSGGSGLSNYKLERSDNGGAFSQIATPATNSYAESGLAIGYYVYRVKAVDGVGHESGDSGSGPQVDVVPPLSTPGVIASSPNPSRGFHTVVWGASTGPGELLHYEVERNDGMGWGSPVIALIPALSESDVPEGTYTYRVRAKEVGGEYTDYSPVSDPVVVDATPPTQPGTPSVPGSSSGSHTVTWAASTDSGVGLASYQLERSSDAGQTFTVIAYPLGTTYPDLTGSGTFVYRVRALDHAANASIYSGTSNSVVVTTPPPLPPTNVRITNYNGVIDIEWDPSASPASVVEGYNVYRKLPAESWPGTRLNSNVIIGTKYRDQPLTNDITYVYRVTTVEKVQP